MNKIIITIFAIAMFVGFGGISFAQDALPGNTVTNSQMDMPHSDDKPAGDHKKHAGKGRRGHHGNRARHKMMHDKKTTDATADTTTK